MALTKDEALVAAAAARLYPVGHGHDWGWGPLKDVEQLAIEGRLQTKPELGLEFG